MLYLKPNKCVFDLYFESLVLTVSQPPTRAYTHYPNFKVLQNTREKCHTSLKITSPHLDLTDAQTNRSAKCNLEGKWNVKQKMRSSACLQHEPSEKTLHVQQNMGRENARKAVISHHKTWEMVAYIDPSLTGGGPSGAVRRVEGHNCGGVARLSPVGQLNAKQEYKTDPRLPAEVLCQQRSRTLPLKVLCLPHLYCTGHTSWANRSASLSTIHPFSQPASQPASQLSPTGPTSCSCQPQIIWHDIMQAPSQIIRNTRRQTPCYAPFPTFLLLRSRLGAITAWLSHNTAWDNLTSVQSGVLSLSLRPWAGIQDSVSNTCVCYLQIGFPPPRGPGA